MKKRQILRPGEWATTTTSVIHNIWRSSFYRPDSFYPVWTRKPTNLQKRLAYVRSLPRTQRDAVLTAALNHAHPDERDAIALEALAASAHPLSKSLVGTVLAHWDVLSLTVRRRALESVSGSLPDVFRRLRLSQDPAERRAAVVLAVACLADALQRDADREAPLPPALDEAALRDPELAAELDAVLAEAARRLDDHPTRRERDAAPDPVLSIIVRVAHAPGPNLRKWLNTPTEGHMPLRAIAKALPRAEQLDRAVAWLAVKALRPVAIAALETDPADGARRLARSAHLLTANARTKALRRLRDPAMMLPANAALDAMPTTERLGAIRLLGLLDIKPEHRLAYCARRLTDPAPEVRLAALAALAAQRPSPELDSALLDFAFDEHPRVAARAAGCLAGANSYNRRVTLIPAFENLARSPHSAVRTIAAAALRATDPRADLDATDRFACPVAARRALKLDPDGLTQQIGDRTTSEEPGQRSRAFLLADRLALLEHVEAALIDAVKNANTALAATAVRLLAKLPGPGPASVLRLALAHKDARVRANAVEGIAINQPADPKLEVLIADPIPRIRGNALRHVLRRAPKNPPACAELSRMLEDARAPHRLTALWVAERLGHTPSARRVAEIAASDPDAAVHRRAVRCARRLLAEMRSAKPTASIVTQAADAAPSRCA